MKRIKKKNFTRVLRLARVRAKSRGTAVKPRLSVFRSNSNVYVQLIDDAAGKTLVSGSFKDAASVTAKKAPGARISKAHALGKAVAEKAKKAGITTIFFDRGAYAYHGRVQAVAEGAREGGLKF
jgi:large subunit ribosomal protein L18